MTLACPDPEERNERIDRLIPTRHIFREALPSAENKEISCQSSSIKIGGPLPSSMFS